MVEVSFEYHVSFVAVAHKQGQQLGVLRQERRFVLFQLRFGTQQFAVKGSAGKAENSASQASSLTPQTQCSSPAT